jgi:hypothetical protein
MVAVGVATRQPAATHGVVDVAARSTRAAYAVVFGAPLDGLLW